MKNKALAFINALDESTLKSLFEHGGRVFLVKDADGKLAWHVSPGNPFDRACHEWIYKEGAPQASITIDADPDFTTDEDGEIQGVEPSGEDLAAVREHLRNGIEGLVS